MKNKLILAAFGLILAACSRGPSEESIRCNNALILAQPFWGFKVSDLQKAIPTSKTLSAVPIIYGQQTLLGGDAKRGTLVVEVDRPLGSSEAVIHDAPIRNLYCL